jgi:cystathionine beta-lyase/cystathionine gamma-synthase
LRLSTGIEDVDDLYRDLDAALRDAHRQRSIDSD